MQCITFKYLFTLLFMDCLILLTLWLGGVLFYFVRF